MGKTNRPLRILVLPDLAAHPRIVELAEKGHTVTPLEVEADVILGGRCWRMTPELADRYLDVALKEIRRVVYAKEAE